MEREREREKKKVCFFSQRECVAECEARFSCAHPEALGEESGSLSRAEQSRAAGAKATADGVALAERAGSAAQKHD